MKIGILTFHWATNYGAILQAYCLQNYLISIGYDVSIIIYKPCQFDFSWKRIVTHPSCLKRISQILFNKRKELILEPFRRSFLHLTDRYYSFTEFCDELNQYDTLIAGSDQVLNPSFTLYGEDGGMSPVYWLNIGGDSTKRIGYSVSFGCEIYPCDAAIIAKKYIQKFNAIGTREQTGISIIDDLGFKGYRCLTPDPTILYGDRLFKQLNIDTTQNEEDYTCIYMLRHEIKIPGNVRYIDERHTPLNMEDWLITIVSSKQLITNSYHGTIMALLAHVPFAVLLETGTGKGMNDRFMTLMETLHISNRLANNLEDAIRILNQPMDFNEIDCNMDAFRKVGVDFLNKNLS